MCFTVNLNLVKEELEKRYGSNLLDPDKYRPSYYYHAFGIPELPAICSVNPGSIRMLKWGLVPSWVKSRESADEIRLMTFNARAESVENKPSFSESFESKRCIIPVRGFYEWQHTPAGKIPYYVYRNDGDIMSLAGLWSEWTDTSTGEISGTFSIITATANDMMAEIHNSKKRMPAVIERASESLWLDLSARHEDLKRLLLPYPSEILNAHTISDLINKKNAEKNTPEIIKPFIRPAENTLF